MDQIRRRYDRPVRPARRLHRARALLVAATVGGALLVLAVGVRFAPEAQAAGGPTLATPVASAAIGRWFGSSLRDQLAATQGQLDLANAQIDRLRAIVNYSTHYKIPADLAASIYDIALAERVEPDLAFRMVSVESDFNQHATSPAGALGLMQIMPSTARFFMPDATVNQLYNRETNLRVGLRYLHTLVRENNRDLRRALLIYNRGEIAVTQSLEQGVNPSNGYDRIVIKGYKGDGILD